MDIAMSEALTWLLTLCNLWGCQCVECGDHTM